MRQKGLSLQGELESGLMTVVVFFSSGTCFQRQEFLPTCAECLSFPQGNCNQFPCTWDGEGAYILGELECKNLAFWGPPAIV